VNLTTWSIPGVGKGQSTTPPNGMALLPIAFVAVRALAIKGNWSNEDVANAARATDFGPFKVDNAIVNGTLSHPGLQIVGWLLQKMPSLPPNDFIA
jgi:hypothetical protein